MAFDSKNVPMPVKLFCASMGGVVSTMVCFPLDVLRLNMQVAGEGGQLRQQITTMDFIRHIVKRDGVRGLYAGLTGSMLRQAMYTGSRLGGHKPGLFMKMVIGMFTGAIGGVVGLPADVTLTRQAVDRSLPPDQQRRYTHVFNGIHRILREEGARTLFRGLTPTVLRAIVVNTSQVTSYVEAKEILIDTGLVEDNFGCHVMSSLIASFISAIASLPVDIAKTRMQKMPYVDGKPKYRNTFDVWFQLITKEGVFALWKGLTPFLIRNGPQVIVLFLVYENLMLYYKNKFDNT